MMFGETNCVSVESCDMEMVKCETKMSVGRQKRDSRMDLMRLVFMFMICMVHAVGHENARWCHWLTNISFAGVLGFVLISGYYGIRFSWMKVVKIEGVGLGCAITVMTLVALCGSDAISSRFFVSEVIRLYTHYWFIHAYVLLMWFAPLVGLGDELPRREFLRKVLPILVAIFGWSFAMLIPGVQRLVPRTEGLVSYSGVTLFGTYLIGRLYRLGNWDSKLNYKVVLPAMAICGFMAASCVRPFSGWGNVLARYNSPFLLVFSIGLFWLLRRGSWQCSRAVERILSWMMASVLSVYLLHCNSYGYEAFGWLENLLRKVSIDDYGAFVIIALGAFVIGSVLDVPRRVVLILFRERPFSAAPSF